MSIAYGHFEIGVAQEFLNRLQAGPHHDQVGSKGVAQVMEGEIGDPGLAAGGGKGLLHLVEPAPLGIDEHSVG